MRILGRVRRRLLLSVLAVIALLVAVGAVIVRSRSSADGPADGGPPLLVAPTPPRQGTHDREPRMRAATTDADIADAHLHRERTIRGTVFDPDGRPIGGATVTVCPPDPSRRIVDGYALVDFAHPRATTVTAADGDVGTYEVTFDAAEDLVLVARKDGYAQRSMMVSQDDIEDLHLDPGRVRTFEVVDVAGRPVAGAEVRRLDDRHVVSDAAVTDAEGRARLVVTGTVSEDVLVHAVGFTYGEADATDGPAARDPIRVVLVEGRSVAGIVVDESGKPMAGVRVSVLGEGQRTAADGRFSIDGLPAGRTFYDSSGFSLHALIDGWCGGGQIVVPGDLAIRVVLCRTATVRGVVVHEDGSPAAGADVYFFSVKTDRDGRFELPEFASGHQLVRASAGLPLDQRVPVYGAEYADAPPGGTVDGLRIVLAPDPGRSYVDVRVVHEDGRPAPSADFRAWDGDVQIDGYSTDDDGSYFLRVHSLTGSRLRIAASVPGPPALDAVTEHVVETRSSPPFETIMLRLGPPAARLRLRAVDPDGRDVPIDPAHVDADSKSLAAADGMWPLLATQPFFARVRVPGFAVRTVELYQPHARLREETIRLVPAGGVRGRVLRPDGSAAEPGLHVMVEVRDAVTGEWERSSALVAAGGRVELTSLPAGPARIYVLNESETLLFRAFDVAAGATTDLGDLRLAGPTAFRGVAVDELGRGVGGAVVTLTDPGGGFFRRAIYTRPDGTFDVTVPGSYPMLVRVTRVGRATQFVSTTPETPLPVRVVLGPSGLLRVRVDHGPGEREPIKVRLPGTDWEWAPPRAIDPADPDGELDGDVYGDLPPGRFDVVVRVTGQPDRVQRVEIVAGRTVECVFDR